MTSPGAVRTLHTVPAPPRTKGKGGGSRDGYDAAVERIYRDDRMGRPTREIALLLAWLVCRDPNRFNAGAWHRAEAILGTKKYGRHTQSVAGLLLADDLPRYEVDRSTPEWLDQTCSAPMIRRSGVCGQQARDNSYTADPVTGWRTPVWFCRRHEDFGRAADRALEQAPEPVPNRGGLLPGYFRLKGGMASWEQNYRWAAHQADPFRYEAWQPPSHGMNADLWPAPGREPQTADAAPKLQLVVLDGELVDTQTPPSEGERVT